MSTLDPHDEMATTKTTPNPARPDDEARRVGPVHLNTRTPSGVQNDQIHVFIEKRGCIVKVHRFADNDSAHRARLDAIAAGAEEM